VRRWRRYTTDENPWRSHLNLKKIGSVAAPATGVVGVQRIAASFLPGQLVAAVFAADRPGS